MIEFRDNTIYKGPNIWARMPVIRITVDIGELEERPSNKIPGFYDQLVELIPTLYDHFCSVGRPGGFLERVEKGTWMGHILEHIAIELQNLAGADVTRGKTRHTGETGVYNVVFEYEQQNVGLAAAELARRLLNHLIYGIEPNFDFQSEFEDQVVRVAQRLAYGPSTGAIVSEAKRRGIPVIRLDPRRSLVQLGHGCHQKRIWATVTSETSNIAVNTASNKELTNRLLHEVGIPVPQGKTVRTVEDAVTSANSIGYPVVLKPLDGNHGRGVCINLKDKVEIREFYEEASSESRNGTVVVERFVEGQDYRILVIAGEVVAVAERVPAHVVGDGQHTVQELIDLANMDPRRGVGHEKVMTRISIDQQTHETLERQGSTLEDVPETGETVWLKRTANMSTGGTAIDRTDDIHPDNEQMAELAAQVVGLDIAGIDFIVPDISKSLRSNRGAIVEVNAGPGFRMHTNPTDGHPRHVGRAVVDMLFEPGANSRIPIVAVTGTNGKTTTVRMISHIMKTGGRTVGMTTSDGIYVDGTRILEGDMSGPNSAQMILKNPTVDYAVLETARGGILRSGLGFDRCDIAVVTNVAGDHLGLKGIDTLEDLAKVKEVVPRSVFRDGCSVLNADDERTAAMSRYARGEILYFSMDEDNSIIRGHIRRKGRAVVLKRHRAGEMITIVEPRRETSLLLASQIPATFDGRLRVNIQNALAAAAAGLAADALLEHIRQALRTFTTSYFQTPGRFNHMEFEGRRIIMDYCHNVSGLESMADFIARLEPARAVGLISMPGDRLDEDMRTFGELAGRTFDVLYIREDTDKRGRERGEIAKRLKSGAEAGGLAAENIHIVLEEQEAVEAAIRESIKDDLVVLFVDRPAESWETLNNLTGSFVVV